uniref:Uncharacterized protein n=1 Tax=Vitis vinifera TaxID=29760 RepID=A5AHR2_VITVI|nr:hypothetical protein VITISV_001511 [Vitis vinifera]
MATRKGREGEMLESVYSVIALVFVLVACVELCDAATVVDVYRLIQYDLAGVPFGSRLANLNHHAASGFAPAADLSRTVVIVPVRDINITFIGGSTFQNPQIPIDAHIPLGKMHLVAT